MDPTPPAADGTGAAAAPGIYGKAKSVFEGAGVGWLMGTQELDDQDDGEQLPMLALTRTLHLTQKPLMEELDINPKDILAKIKAVLLPISISNDPATLIRLTEPDFWGPFLVIVAYGLLLAWNKKTVSPYLHWSLVSWVFFLWVIGSLIVYVLAKALGGGNWEQGGYGVVLSVIGYSLIPMVFLALFHFLISYLAWPVILVMKALCVLWCSWVATTMLMTAELKPKRIMFAYPVILLYMYFTSLHTGA
eukprot:gene2430-3208_t